MSFTFDLLRDDDQPAIDTMLDQGFGLSRRTKASYRLREGNTRIVELSLVLREPLLGVVAAISYWPIVIGRSRSPALLLGPLIIHHARQGRGIGLAIMQQSLKRAQQLGHRLVILVGDEPYYARVGFQRVPEGRLQLPGPADPKRFLYKELQDHALQQVQGLILPPWR